MRLRSAVLQIPPKSSVPPRLPLYKNRYSLTRSESTLLQVLIPLHFNSFISNTYKKQGGGCLPQDLKDLQLVTPPASSLSPLAAALACHSQPAGNPATLSPLPVYPDPRRATLTRHVKPNPCVCNSYKKHGGGHSSHLHRKSPLQLLLHFRLW